MFSSSSRASSSMFLDSKIHKPVLSSIALELTIKRLPVHPKRIGS